MYIYLKKNLNNCKIFFMISLTRMILIILLLKYLYTLNIYFIIYFLINFAIEYTFEFSNYFYSKYNSAPITAVLIHIIS